jgi:hypothetical protein
VLIIGALSAKVNCFEVDRRKQRGAQSIALDAPRFVNIFGFTLQHQASLTMHLMYFLDDGGNRVYTLKVRLITVSLQRLFLKNLISCRRRTRPARPQTALTQLASAQMISLAVKEYWARRDLTFFLLRYLMYT